LYINQQQIYTHDPITNGNGLIDLFPEPVGQDINVDQSDSMVPPANSIVALVSLASSSADMLDFPSEIGIEWARMERDNSRERISGLGIPPLWDQSGKDQVDVSHTVVEEPFTNNTITNGPIQRFARETNLLIKQASDLTDPFESEADLVFGLLGKEDVLSTNFRRGIL